MQDNGDQPGGAVRECDAPGGPARLKRLGLLVHIRTVCGGHRRKQRAEFGSAVSAENGGIFGQRFQIQKKRILSLSLRLIRSDGDELTEQAECRNAAVIAGEVTVFLRPQILHLIGIVLGVGGDSALKAVRQPFTLNTGVELVHPVKKAADPGLVYARVLKQPGEQSTGILVRQIGVFDRFRRRLRDVRLCFAAAGGKGGKDEADSRKDRQQMVFPIHKLRYLSCVRPFCGAEQSASYVFILYTYWRKISIQNSMGHLDRCGFLLFSHKICRIRTAHTANEMCMKFSCTISGCPAGARKWHISYFATLLHSKKGTPP